MTNTKVVHLVDDEESIRKSVGFMLRTAGYTVKAWSNGTGFLRASMLMSRAARSLISACPTWTGSRCKPC